MSLNKGSYNMTGDGSTLAPGAFRVRTTNPDLKWERTYQTNVGFDAAFFNNRVQKCLHFF